MWQIMVTSFGVIIFWWSATTEGTNGTSGTSTPKEQQIIETTSKNSKTLWKINELLLKKSTNTNSATSQIQPFLISSKIKGLVKKNNTKMKSTMFLAGLFSAFYKYPKVQARLMIHLLLKSIRKLSIRKTKTSRVVLSP